MLSGLEPHEGDKIVTVSNNHSRFHFTQSQCNASKCSSGLYCSCCIQISTDSKCFVRVGFYSRDPCTAAAQETTMHATCNVHLTFPLPALNSCPKPAK